MVSVRVKYLKPNERYGELIASEIPFLRNLSLLIDESPDLVLQHLDRPLFKKVLSHLHDSCYEKLRLYEGIAYGDLGALFAMPRPCLSGLFLKEIGSVEQQNFYQKFLLEHKPKTFFAVTEPDFGSDAVNMQTKLTRKNNGANDYVLNGEKWLFGNAAVGKIGVVLARTSSGPLGITGILLTPDDTLKNHIWRNSLSLGGMRPSSLGYAKYSDYPIMQNDLIGTHVNPIERGTITLVKTFNKMRICICGLALGVAQALIDYVTEQAGDILSERIACELKELQEEINYYRFLIYDLAKILENAPLETGQVSILKYKSTRLLEKTARQAVKWMGRGVLIRDPWLALICRNAFALEYTDGTTIIHQKNIYQDYIRKRLKI